MSGFLLPPRLLAAAVTWLSLCPAGAQAQQVEPLPVRHRPVAVKVNAFQPLLRGYQLEVERSLFSHPRHSFTFSPEVFYGHVPDISSHDAVQPAERVSGYGAALQHRIYLAPLVEAPLAGFYFGYGPHFQRLALKFQENGWQDVIADDGLKYYQFGPVDYTEKVTRYGATAVLGYQGPLELGPIYFDFYVGLGMRQSQSRSGFPTSRYRTGWLDYAHRGVYVPAGFKVGIVL